MNRVVSIIISLGLLYLSIVVLYVLYRAARMIYIYTLDTLDRDPHSKSLNRKVKVLNLMNKYEFKLLHKKHNDDMFSEQSKFKNTYNYIFKKLN